MPLPNFDTVHRLFLIAFLVTGFFSGCATEEVSDSSPIADCGEENLINDPQFETLLLSDSPWRYSQHTGEKSFSVSSEAGVLELRRTGDEPWMILQQAVNLPAVTQLGGETLAFSALVKGQADYEPRMHAFEHKAGLYLRVGQERSANLADHEPNRGNWEWQRIRIERNIPQGTDYVHVGFVHQAGGAVWFEDPTATLTGCVD